MTQERKDLLLKDLCARLPYGVKGEKYTIRMDGEFVPLIDVEIITAEDIITLNGCPGYMIKPYLFPLSSMTEEQEEELDKYLDMDSKSLIDGYKNGLKCAHPYFNVQDWYNKNHFDYRGLIPMGLAKDATGKNIY